MPMKPDHCCRARVDDLGVEKNRDSGDAHHRLDGGVLYEKGQIDCVIVGADRITANGDTANKIGTYSVCVLAKETRCLSMCRADEHI